MNPTYTVAAIVAVVAGFIGFFLNNFLTKKRGQSLIDDAKQKEKEIIDEAKAVAQKELQKAQKKVKELKDKETAERKSAERELQKRRQELERQESALNARLEKIDARSENLEKRADALRDREGELEKLKQESLNIIEQQKKELERVAGLTPEQAKEQLMKKLEDELQYEIAVKVNEAEQKIKSSADIKSKEILATSIQRCATDTP